MHDDLLYEFHDIGRRATERWWLNTTSVEHMVAALATHPTFRLTAPEVRRLLALSLLADAAARASQRPGAVSEERRYVLRHAAAVVRGRPSSAHIDAFRRGTRGAFFHEEDCRRVDVAMNLVRPDRRESDGVVGDAMPLHRLRHDASRLASDGLDRGFAAPLACRLRAVVGNPFRPITRICYACRGTGTCLYGECRSELHGKPAGRIRGVDPAWLSDDVARVAASLAAPRTGLDGGTILGSELPVLADALEDAGCDDERLLMPLRGFASVPLSFCTCDGLRMREIDVTTVTDAACGKRTFLQNGDGCDQRVRWLPQTAIVSLPLPAESHHVLLAIVEAAERRERAATPPLRDSPW